MNTSTTVTTTTLGTNITVKTEFSSTMTPTNFVTTKPTIKSQTSATRKETSHFPVRTGVSTSSMKMVNTEMKISMTAKTTINRMSQFTSINSGML